MFSPFSVCDIELTHKQHTK